MSSKHMKPISIVSYCAQCSHTTHILRRSVSSSLAATCIASTTTAATSFHHFSTLLPLSLTRHTSNYHTPLFCRFSSPHSLSLLTSRMSGSTLHKGVRDGAEEEEEENSWSNDLIAATPFRNLGEGFAVKSDVNGRMGHGRTETQQGRSFNDVLRIIDEMTSGRPNRCSDNLQITQRLIDRLDLQDVMGRIRFVHVAGTKGKGTTSAYTAALLQAYGYKVGLFTSPHLLDVRERILVDNTLLSSDTFARYFFEFRDKYKALKYSESQVDRETASRANFFRFMFLLSLYIFGEENVQVAVMEVGLGGRIDATNVIPSTVSVITSLGYDHMEILGDSIDGIAEEKAGIMKSNVVCFASPQLDHPGTRKVLEKHALGTPCPLVLLDKDVLPILNWPRLSIGGDHAVEDSKLALLASRYIAGIPSTIPLDEVEREVLQTMTFAGRSQVVPIGGGAGADMTLYLDGAHTPESLTHATRWFLEASATHTGDDNPRRVLLFYTSRDPHRVLKAFMPYISHFCKVVVTQLDNPKMTATSVGKDNEAARGAAALEEMIATTECWRNMYREVPCLPCAKPFGSIDDMLELIVPSVTEGEDASKPAQVFVCGSFYLLGNILVLLRDYKGDGKLQSEQARCA